MKWPLSFINHRLSRGTCIRAGHLKRGGRILWEFEPESNLATTLSSDDIADPWKEGSPSVVNGYQNNYFLRITVCSSVGFPSQLGLAQNTPPPPTNALLRVGASPCVPCLDTLKPLASAARHPNAVMYNSVLGKIRPCECGDESPILVVHLDAVFLSEHI